MTELLFREDAYLKTASARVLAVHPHGIELDRTIFYPMGGGQVGDTGVLVRANGERIAIADTRKGEMDTVLHVPLPGTVQPDTGETLTLEIDWARRYSMRNSGWPYSTGCPFSTRIAFTTPVASDSISFRSFIASMMQRVWPLVTDWPISTNAGAPGDGAR